MYWSVTKLTGEIYSNYSMIQNKSIFIPDKQSDVIVFIKSFHELQKLLFIIKQIMQKNEITSIICWVICWGINLYPTHNLSEYLY